MEVTKKKQSRDGEEEAEMQNTKTEIKNSLEATNSRVQEAEE